MSKKEVYNKISEYLIKFSVLFFIIIVCLTFFFLTKRTKGPRIAISLMEILKNSQIDSCIFKSLEESFVVREEIENLKQKLFLEDEDFLYFEILPKYPLLLNLYNFLPLELWLYKGKEIIPFREKELILKEPASWYFDLNNKRKLLYIDAKDMEIKKDAIYVLKEPDGMLLAENSYIYSTIELPKGLKEFKITAKGKCVIPEDKKRKDFDYSAEMRISIDNKVLGEVFASEDRFNSFVFYTYVSGGWHKIEIAFTNDVWEPERGLDRNLLVKGVEIFDFPSSIYLRIKKGLEEKFLPYNYILSYFRELDSVDKNDLINFYKNRFNIVSLREIVLNGGKVAPLIEDVEINRLVKKAIFAPAPTKIETEYGVPLDGIKLVFSFGVMEEAWNKPGDGVEFKIKLANSKDESGMVIFSKYINPKTNPQDRKWHSGEIDLTRFKGKKIRLIFETNGSVVSPITPTQDYAYDYAVWSD